MQVSGRSITPAGLPPLRSTRTLVNDDQCSNARTIRQEGGGSFAPIDPPYKVGTRGLQRQHSRVSRSAKRKVVSECHGLFANANNRVMNGLVGRKGSKDSKPDRHSKGDRFLRPVNMDMGS